MMITSKCKLLAIGGLTVVAAACTIVAGTSAAMASSPAALTSPKVVPALSAMSPATAAGQVHNNALYGISCKKWTQCLAVGSRARGTAVNFRPLSEAWNGRHWKVVPMPGPTSRSRALATAISCKSPSDCVASGYHYSPTEGGYAPLAELWNGKSWHIIQQRSPATTSSSFLNDVSCLAYAGCLAVGGSAGANGNGQAIAERWTAGHWHFLKVPQPASAVATELDGIGCTGKYCMAVGMYEVSGGRVYAMTERWDGNSWNLLPAVSAQAPYTELNAVSCHTASVCMAVGDTDWTQTRPFSELWKNGHWRQVFGSRRAGGALTDVTCPDTNWCLAVGWANRKSLAELWSGKRWRVTTAQWAPGRQANELSQVSCPHGISWCATVGARYQPGQPSGEATLAEWWNGRSLRLMTTAGP